MRLIVAMVVALGLLFGVSFLSSNALSDGSRALVAHTDDLLEETDRESWAEADARMGEIEERWEKESKVWQMLILHTEIDQVNAQVVRTRAALEARDIDRVRMEASLLRELMDHIHEWDELRLENIL